MVCVGYNCSNLMETCLFVKSCIPPLSCLFLFSYRLPSCLFLPYVCISSIFYGILPFILAFLNLLHVCGHFLYHSAKGSYCEAALWLPIKRRKRSDDCLNYTFVSLSARLVLCHYLPRCSPFALFFSFLPLITDCGWIFCLCSFYIYLRWDRFPYLADLNVNSIKAMALGASH